MELQKWADVSTPEDIEKFYREGFPYYHSAFSILDADNFLFITNENPWRAIPVFCYNKDECRLARYMNNIYVTNNLNDYVIQNSGELSITPNGIEYIEKYSGCWHKRVIATPTQMLGLYGNDFCRKLFNFITKETNDPIERMCQERLKKFFEEDLNE